MGGQGPDAMERARRSSTGRVPHLRRERSVARMSAAERRTLLVEAAIAVMARDGVAHTTTRAIVAEAGMQIGVFHYCFRSKEELVLEVMRTISTRAFEAVAEVLTRTDDPAELIQRSVAAYWEHIEQDPLEHM